MIRIGILGCASIAKRSLAPAFVKHPKFKLVSVASRTSDKANEFAKCFGARPDSYDELVSADDVDLIYCPLPTGLHFEWVRKCLAAGKHVLCEKSLASTEDEARQLVQLARAKHRFLMESFQFRFHDQNLYVKELLSQNTIGPIRQIIVRFGIPPFPDGLSNIRYSRKLGGGALLDNGAYTIKATTYLLGSDIKMIAAMKGGECAELGNVDLIGALMMKSADGVPVQTSYGFDHFYQNGYEIWGKNGKISTSRAFTARNDYDAPVIVETLAGREVHYFKDDHFAKLLSYVADCILSSDFETEYAECIVQAALIQHAKEKMK